MKSIEKKLLAGFALSLALVAALGLVSVVTSEQLIGTRNAVLQSRQVIAALDDTLLTVTAAETAQRAYLITGKAAYLAPYAGAVERINADLAGLATLTTDDPHEQARIPALQMASAARLEDLRDTIAVRRSAGYDAARAVVNGGQGIAAMDSLRSLIGAMITDEQQLLALRTQRSADAVQHTPWLIAALVGLDLPLIIVLFGTVRSHLRQRRRAESALRASEERTRTLLSSLPQHVFYKDHSLVFRSVNPAFAADYHMAPEGLVGKTDYELYPAELAAKYRADDLRVMANRQAETIEEINSVDGNERIVEVVKAPVIADGAVIGVIGVFTDITERKRSEALLRDLALRDALTGLNNRRELFRQLEQEWQRATRYERPLALILLDVDHFKAVNDELGHPQGDQLLAELGRVLRTTLRSTDIAGRYGGEEFAIIMPECSGPEAAAAAERLRQVVAANAFTRLDSATNKPLTMTISLGVAAYPTGADSEEALVAAADRALYQAKQAGRNRVGRGPEEAVPGAAPAPPVPPRPVARKLASGRTSR